MGDWFKRGLFSARKEKETINTFLMYLGLKLSELLNYTPLKEYTQDGYDGKIISLAIIS